MVLDFHDQFTGGFRSNTFILSLGAFWVFYILEVLLPNHVYFPFFLLFWLMRCGCYLEFFIRWLFNEGLSIFFTELKRKGKIREDC